MFAFLSQYTNRLRGAGWALADQGVVSAGNFITMYLLARYMDISAFGIFVLAYTGLRLATSFQNTAITEPHNSLAAKLDGLEYRRFTSLMGVWQVLFAFGWFALLAAVGGILDIAGLPRQGFASIFLGAMLVPWMGQEFVRRILYTRRESGAAFVNDCVSYGAQAAGVVLFVQWYGEPSVVHALLSYGLSSLLATILGLWQLRSHLVWDRSIFERGFMNATRHRVWEFAKWLTGGNLVKWFGDNGTTWVMGVILGTLPLGAYKAACQIGNVLNPFQQAFIAYLPSVAASRFQREGKQGLRRMLRNTMLYLAVPYTALGILVMVLAKPLLHLAYGDKFANQGLEWILILVALIYVLSFVKGLLRLVFMALEVSRPLFVASTMSAILMGTTGIALIYYFGIIGGPIATLIQLVFTLVYFMIVYRRLMRDDQTIPILQPVRPAPVDVAA